MFNYNLFLKLLSNRKLRTSSFIKNEIATRLLSRLDFVKLQPSKILVSGYYDSNYLKKLEERFPSTKIYANNYDNECFDIIISNTIIHLTDSISTNLDSYFDNLSDDGILLFSTFGDKSFQSLEQAFKKVDDNPHTNSMIDLLTWGNTLQTSKYKNSAVESDKFTLTYQNISTLFNDIRDLNEPLADTNMRDTLTGKNRWHSFMKAFQKDLQLEIEALYAYAEKKDQAKIIAPQKNLNRISLEDLKKQISEFKKI